jgi:coproporphyrinogen III oxidase
MTNSTIDIAVIKDYFLGLQNRITTAISALDGKAFMVDEWQKPPESKLRGSGRTCILENGNVLEKAGVGFSHVHGDQMPGAASQNRPEVAGRGFEAMGVSLVFHPHNPKAPTVHMNVFYCPSSEPRASLVVWWGVRFNTLLRL